MKWFPSNSSDAYTIDRHCANCAHEPDCPLLAKAMLGEVNEIEEWTADDTYGRGFRCAKQESKP